MSYPLTRNPHRHYYTSRRSRILGIVLHTTAGIEDYTPPDDGAESTVRYGLRNSRPASWHAVVDSDSIIDCLPDSYTAFHVVGYNSSTLGLEIANRDARWTGKPPAWVEATIRNAAAWCRPKVTKYGLPIQLANKAQVDAAVRAGRPFGFSYHYMLNPGAKIDPGRDFPWAMFERFLRAGVSGAGASRLPADVVPPPGVGVIGDSRFTVDGLADAATIKSWQRIWGAHPDGVWGPQTVRAMQRWLGVPVTGRWGPPTRDALYQYIGYEGTRDWVLSGGPTEQTRLLEAKLNADADELARTGPPPRMPSTTPPLWPLPSTHRLGANPKHRATWHDGHGSDAAGRAAIRTWQTRMIARGWDLGPTGADGLWGPRTERAAAAFKKEKRITETGVGPITWAAAWKEAVT